MNTRDLISAQLAMVPKTLNREHVETTIRGFLDTYPVKDVQKRMAYFDKTALMEDPAGVRVATGSDELETFFSNVAGIANLRLTEEQLVVVGNEALLVATLDLQVGDLEHEQLRLFFHFVFDDDGLITSLRTFFDSSCIV